MLHSKNTIMIPGATIREQLEKSWHVPERVCASNGNE